MVGVVGFVLLVLVVVGVPLAVTAADLFIVGRGKHPVGYYVNWFARTHPFYAGVLAAVVGAMISHFFLHLRNG